MRCNRPARGSHRATHSLLAPPINLVELNSSALCGSRRAIATPADKCAHGCQRAPLAPRAPIHEPSSKKKPRANGEAEVKGVDMKKRADWLRARPRRDFVATFRVVRIAAAIEAGGILPAIDLCAPADALRRLVRP